jgi:hypothetical protein
MFLIILCFFLNLGISWWNCYAVGSCWTEAKAAGGWPRFMSWMVAIMAACGFTSCYLLALGGIGYSMHLLSPLALKYMLEIGYVMIVPGLLFAGFCMMIDSWARAYREGGVLNYGIAGWNTYAQIHNTASAVSGMGEALGDLFSGAASAATDSDDIKVTALIFGAIAACIAAGAGIITTVCLIKKYSASKPLPSYEELQARAAAKAAAER